jgi:K+-sensing histidine kinase KdpD
MAEEKKPETATVLASFAHDLRSPLNAVIGFSRIMLKGIDGPLSEMQAADLEAINANGNTMLEMVDNLIDLAKVEAGWLTPSPSSVHVHPLLEKVMSLTTPVAKGQGIELGYETGDGTYLIQVDPPQVQKAIEKLVTATMRLVGSGKIVVTTETTEERAIIHIAGSNLGGLAREAMGSIEAFGTAGASVEHRIDATALLLLVGEQLLVLNRGSLEIKERSETQVVLSLAIPLVPL